MINTMLYEKMYRNSMTIPIGMLRYRSENVLGKC